MVVPPVSPARFPGVARAAAHYESFYLKACHPGGGRAVWIRYTVHKRPDAAPKGFVWFTWFDARSGVLASKAEFPHPAPGPPEYIRLGDCVLAPRRATGQALSNRLGAVWDLEFEADEAPLRHLPRWAYEAPLPRTKVLTQHPRAIFSGGVEIDARRVEIAGWPGMVGHNWGSEHPRRAIWIHGTSFRDHEDAWLDLALGRIGLGPLTTPWIGNGALSLHGRRYRLGGLERLHSTHVEEDVERCGFRLTGDQVTVEGTVSAPRRSFVGWTYAQPNGGDRQTINCSIADLRLEVARRGLSPLRLEVAGGAAYELQMEERYPPIPVQPFPDG